MTTRQAAELILPADPCVELIPKAEELKDRWMSVELCFDGSIYDTVADTIVQDVIQPITQSLLSTHDIDGFFFVRYRRGGSHIRLRLRSRRLDSRDGWRDCSATITSAVSDTCLSVNTTNTITLRPGSYAPEFDRYGGHHVMPITEAWFQASSEVAIQLLPKRCSATRGAHIARAFCITLTVLHAAGLTLEGVRKVAGTYERGILQRLAAEGSNVPLITERINSVVRLDQKALSALGESVWSALENNEDLSPFLTNFHERSSICFSKTRELIALGLVQVMKKGHVIPIRNWDDWIELVAASFIHMTCNRLGVPRDHEAYMARLLGEFGH